MSEIEFDDAVPKRFEEVATVAAIVGAVLGEVGGALPTGRAAS